MINSGTEKFPPHIIQGEEEVDGRSLTYIDASTISQSLQSSSLRSNNVDRIVSLRHNDVRKAFCSGENPR